MSNITIGLIARDDKINNTNAEIIYFGKPERKGYGTEYD